MRFPKKVLREKYSPRLKHTVLLHQTPNVVQCPGPEIVSTERVKARAQVRGTERCGRPKDRCRESKTGVQTPKRFCSGRFRLKRLKWGSRSGRYEPVLCLDKQVGKPVGAKSLGGPLRVSFWQPGEPRVLGSAKETEGSQRRPFSEFRGQLSLKDRQIETRLPQDPKDFRILKV